MMTLRRTALFASSLLLAGVGTLAPRDASAHFVLDAPDSLMSQDSFGGPQKAPPCGNEGGGTPTGKITAFQAGQVITITIEEIIFHPGHYRVALAPNDPSELPDEPLVTPGSMACGTVPIMNPPVYPVLADGMLPHTQPLSGAQSFQVTLPSDVTCDHCTLQIIEFMSAHPLNNPGGCFYHHCANISISNVSVGAGGASGSGGSGAAGVGSAGGGTAGTGTAGTGTAGTGTAGTGTGGSGTAGTGTAGTGTAGTGGNGIGGKGTGGAGGNGVGGAKSTGGSGSVGGTGTGAAAGSASADAPAADSGSSGGCAVAAPGSAGLSALLGLVGLAGLARRRRRANMA